MKPTPIHWIGGVRHARGQMLAGWPCCCSGPKCEALAAIPAGLTRDPLRVTCKPCLRRMRTDLHADRWGLPPLYQHSEEHKCGKVRPGDKVWYSEERGWYYTRKGEDDCDAGRVTFCPFCGRRL